jgi:outer membrane autotransporter protein
MLRPKLVISQRTIAAVVAPLALVLSMGISHQAMAACTAPNNALPSIVTCTGDDNEYETPNISFSGTVAKTGILLEPVDESASLENEADISISYTGAATGSAAIIGINTNASGEYEVENEGNISVSSSGRGAAYGIAGNGDVEALDITNEDTVIATRTLADSAINQITSAVINLTDNANTVSANPNTNGNNATTNSLGIAAAIFSEEELESFSVTNEDGAFIQADGKFAIGVYNRGVEFSLTNEGTIEHLDGSGNGIAIASVGDSGNTATVEIENEGTIIGDIVLVNGHAQRWWLLSNGDGRGTESTGIVIGGTDIDNRLNINSQFGQVNSEFTNEGDIAGNFFYSNGTHNLVNEGTIVGDIDVDQRPMFIPGRTCTVGADGCFEDPTTTGDTALGNPSAEEASENGSTLITTGAGAGGTTTYTYSLWGTKEFTLENAGTLQGDLTVHTAPATTIGGFDVPDSTVVIAPHIFGGGRGDEDDAVDPAAQAYIDGSLKVADGIVNGVGGTSSIARTTTIEPVIESLVHSGEWYTIATNLYGSDVPEVEESALVSWEAEKNSLDALVIGATVNDASTISGLSNPGIAAINGLMQGGNDTVNALGGALQNLDAEDVRVAGEQLKPETNFATQQAAWTLNFLAGNYIDNRLASVGVTTGGSGGGGGFGAPSGLGMQQSASASQVPEGRMSLGLGSNDGRMNVGANDGRMDAGIYDDQPDTRRYSSAMWGQVFGAGLTQNKRANVDGYDTHIYGAMAGADNWISTHTRLGFAGGYGNTSIDGSGDTEKNKTDIDSYLGILYGAYKGSGWYASGRLGYAWHDYATSRYLTVPFADTATGGHSGDQYTAAGEIGAPFHFMGGALTPVASLTWSQLDQDGYSEASNGGMGLTIASQENTSLSSGLGAKALIPIAIGTLLEGRAIWYHEFEDTNQQVTAAFGGGPNFNAAGPSVGRDTAAVGVGLFAYAQTGVSFQVNYDALLRQDFVGHTGSGRLKVEF